MLHVKRCENESVKLTHASLSLEQNNQHMCVGMYDDELYPYSYHLQSFLALQLGKAWCFCVEVEKKPKYCS